MASVLFWLALVFYCCDGATFTIQNNCPNTVWAGAVPGGGQRLIPSETWTLNVANGTSHGRIWARTKCDFDGSGRGRCQTGDCNGLLQCQGYGAPPNTLVEYALNQPNNLDFFDISLVGALGALDAMRISMLCALASYELLVGTITLVLFSRPINTVVTQEVAGQLIIRDFSKRDAQMLTATQRMTRLAHLHVPEEPITGLYSVPEEPIFPEPPSLFKTTVHTLFGQGQSLVVANNLIRAKHGP